MLFRVFFSLSLSLICLFVVGVFFGGERMQINKKKKIAEINGIIDIENYDADTIKCVPIF